MSSSTYVGNSDAPVSGYCAVPPPPPPPPPVPSQMPTMRISTTEPTLASKRPQFNVNNIDAYEPPAAIQNAMLTKDKKPFTYTPGMGGKLDLSQIRSPRMARRVAKNANDEGIEGPPKSSLEQTKQTTTPTNTSAGIFVQPQVAVPVFPTNVPPQLPTNRNYQTPALNRTLSNATEKQLEPTKNVTKEDVKVTPIQITPVQPNSPETPSTPQVTLIKAPTPWLQNKNKSPEELPEWAKRSTNTKPTQNSSPESPTSPMSHVQFEQQPTPQWQQTQRKQLPTQQKQQPQQYQFQTQPLQSQPQAQPYQPQQKRQTINQAAVQQPERQQTNSQTHQQERVIPIRIEDRPSVFAVKQESSHHQLKQPPSPHHQQRWGQPSSPQSPSQQCQTQTIVNPPQQQHSGGAYIIPIMIESNDKKSNVNSNVASIIVNAQPNIRTNPVRNETPKSIVQQRGPTPNQQQQADIPPVQSRSFRVLQKITDLDSLNDVDLEQLRKLQPSEDDRILMNKFKEQVDGDTYLHQEEDPRYRGAAIPSRAFRFLQNMTESGETTATPATSRVQNVTNKKQNRNSKSFEETQINLPPSEQQVPEPKKYMGSAIPSRSFRILQAMTAPESIATQENRQADYTCQTENNVPGNQQSIYFPPCPVPYWHPDGGWWAYYYPIQYPHVQPAKIVTMNHVSYDPYVCEHRHDNGDAPRVYYHQHDHRPLFDENNRQYEYDPSDYDNTNNGRHGYVKPQFEQVSMNNSQCEKDNTQTLPRDTNELINDGKYQDISVPTTQSQEKTTPISQQSKDPHLGISGWHNINDMSKISSSENNNNNSRNNDENNHRITARLNIIEEEEEVIPKANATTNRSPPTPKDADRSNDNHGNKRDYSSLKVSVPNYTYLDTSDSSDTESDTDSESITETSDSNDISNVETTNDTLSDSDSDSYLAYSTGLNPHHKHDELTSLAVNKDDRNCYNDVSTSSSENLKYIKEEEEEEEEDKEIRENKEQKDKKETIGQSNQTESLENITDTLPSRRSSIIYEDTEHVNTNTSCDQYNFANKWKKKPFETTDDPPDDISTTVSVSLPLRFKFSVSENNEDVTTVIVGDSKIKPEKFNVVKNIESIDLNRLANNESLDNNFRENSSDTTVDFTLKRSINTAKNDNIGKDKGVKDDDEITPHVNFTLKKAPSKVNRIDCGETVVTEFTVKPKPTVDETTPQFRKARLTTSEPTNRKRSSQTIGEAERSKKKEDRTISSTRSQKEQEKKEKNETIEQYLDNRICKDAKSKDIIKLNDFKEQPTLGPELIVSEYTNEKSDGDRIDEKTKEQAEESNQAILTTAITATINDRTDILEENDNSESSRNSDSSRSTAIPCEDVETKQQYQQQQHLLGVYTPREETDDEDSGVTSDMSRMISEAETDSECCATSKNIRKYQRTQTHSRLFRLLNDENDDNETSDARTSNRDCLTLSLNTYPYDDSYCSNYSSGFTSPDYSPVHEHSSKKSQQNNEDFLIVGRPDSQQHDAERHGNTSLHRRGMSLHQHCLPIAKIHKEGSIPNATSTTTNDIYFKTWKDTPKTCNSSEKDDVLRSLAFKTLNRKIPYWAYKVNVLCPRIKSTKNVPRTLKKCPTNDDDENDNGSLIKPTITDPLLSYVDDNNNSNSNNNN